jgi:hypothetical protein
MARFNAAESYTNQLRGIAEFLYEDLDSEKLRPVAEHDEDPITQQVAREILRRRALETKKKK